ncbi:hypothetical protein MCAP1_001721 [Malassezia caprae]|uniref:Uncharacterized protein n=1 Tax=Malassezia caprae TaxID=1381934 RepID=A0AAF0E6P8_9BASI|nr:hypothetical protein MCAP1_001721 [Malassezia caprae]
MVKLSAPLALLALAIAGAAAQAPQSSNAPSSSASQSGSGSAEPSSGAPAPSSNGGKGGDSSSEGGPSSSVCSALFSDPNVHPYDCQASKTVVPPYNLSSLVNYFVGGYKHDRADGAMVSEVADDLAGSVVKYYPTVTQSREDIQWAMYKGLLASIHAKQPDFAPVDEIKPPKDAQKINDMIGVEDGAMRMAVPAAVAFGAAVIGGAILL